MKVSRIGLDLAKHIFQVHAVNEQEQVVLRRQLKRKEVLKFFATLDRVEHCVIGMESCCGSDYWAREFSQLGYQVRIMNPSFVKPYVKSNKNDARDAEAICEAVSRPTMRFVPVKTVAQQDLLLLHRQREQMIKRRTALANQTRGMLMNYGIVMDKTLSKLRMTLPRLLDDANPLLSPLARQVFATQYDELVHLDKALHAIDQTLDGIARQRDDVQRLMRIPGIGPITATAFVAHLGEGRQFKQGRQCSAYLGLVPAQYSSGGKEHLSGISKRGNRYLRTLLIHGARSALTAAKHKIAAKGGGSRREQWIVDLEKRHHTNVAAVALANKNARVAWVLLNRQEDYREIDDRQAA